MGAPYIFLLIISILNDIDYINIFSVRTEIRNLSRLKDPRFDLSRAKCSFNSSSTLISKLPWRVDINEAAQLREILDGT